MSNELKLCQCGGEAELLVTPHPDKGGPSPRMYWVRCKRNDIEQHNEYFTKTEAIAAWNHRPSPWILIKNDDDLPGSVEEVVLWLADNGYIEMGDSETYYESSRTWTHWQKITLPE